jgi:aryl-alcohol dehydrogenase-like predicted oxidoreductase
MGPDAKGLSKSYILSAVEGSLKRLKTDYIDLYQAHRDDPETPLAETLEAFASLVKSGKVRAIGASNYEAPRLAEALRTSKEKGLPRYETLQPNYSLYERSKFESELAGLCARERLTVIPYFPLASGFLTGKYRSERDLEGRPRAMMVKGMLNERGFRILAALDAVSKEVGATLAQVSLAWLMARNTIPIASATTLAQTEELIKATELKLSAEAVAKLDQASA